MKKEADYLAPILTQARKINNYDAWRYMTLCVMICAMIRNFKCAQTELIWGGSSSRQLPQSIQHIARRKLRMLHNSRVLNDLRVPPGNRLEKLKGTRAGQYSIRINDQWQICFVWENGDALNVEIVDYH